MSKVECTVPGMGLSILVIGLLTSGFPNGNCQLVSANILSSQDPNCPGTCTTILLCKAMNGRMNGICMDGKVCCGASGGFNMPTTGSCGSSVVANKVSNFRSPNYPVYSGGTLICEFKLQLNPATIGIRVDFLDLQLPTVPSNPMNFYETPTPICDSDFLIFRGFSGWSPDFRCGNLTGYSLMFERETGQPSLSAIFVMASKRYRWSILFTEMYYNEVESLDYSLRNAAMNNNQNSHKKQWVWYPSAGLNLPLSPITADSPRFPYYHLTPPSWHIVHPLLNRRVLNFNSSEVEFINGTSALFNSTLTTEIDDNDDDPGVLSRIVGGVDAKPNSVPWQVSLQLIPKMETELCGRTKNISAHFCGGSIIGDRTILTASHCFFSSSKYSHPLLPVDELKVVVGEHDLCVENEVASTREYTIARIVLHYNYVESDVLNDIAMIHLTKPIIFNQNVHKINLADENTKLEALKPMLSGWGSLGVEENSTYPSVLQQTSNLHLFSKKECQNFQREFLDYVVPDYELTGKYNGAFDSGICTISTDNLTEAGFGDSGGPLSGIPSGGGAPLLIGIVSHMRPHTDPNTNSEFHLNYFVRVSSYRKWILMSMLTH